MEVFGLVLPTHQMLKGLCGEVIAHFHRQCIYISLLWHLCKSWALSPVTTLRSPESSSCPIHSMTEVGWPEAPQKLGLSHLSNLWARPYLEKHTLTDVSKDLHRRVAWLTQAAPKFKDNSLHPRKKGRHRQVQKAMWRPRWQWCNHKEQSSPWTSDWPLELWENKCVCSQTSNSKAMC